MDLFTDEMTDFLTLSYTSTSEIPTLSYTWGLKKVPISGKASLYRPLKGVPPPPSRLGSRTVQKNSFSTMQSTGTFAHLLTFPLLICFSHELKLDHKRPSEFDHIRSHASSNVQAQAVRDLITRLLPEHSSKFDIVVQLPLKSPHMDEFEYKTTAECKLQIKGTSGVACSLGLQHFLKNHCQGHISWSGDQLKMPEPFPVVKDVLRIRLPYRYFLNSVIGLQIAHLSGPKRQPGFRYPEHCLR